MTSPPTPYALGTFTAVDWPMYTRVEVPSSSPDLTDPYVVFYHQGVYFCDCPGYKYRATCRHVEEVADLLKESTQ